MCTRHTEKVEGSGVFIKHGALVLCLTIQGLLTTLHRMFDPFSMLSGFHSIDREMDMTSHQSWAVDPSVVHYKYKVQYAGMMMAG